PRPADVEIACGRWGETNTDRIHGNILTVDAALGNDEARMTNDEGMTKRLKFGPSTLAFISSFVIRISSLPSVVAVCARSDDATAVRAHSTKIFPALRRACRSRGRFTFASFAPGSTRARMFSTTSKLTSGTFRARSQRR